MAINDTILLQVRGTANTQQHIHTLHFRQMAAGTDAAVLLGIQTVWQAQCAASYRAIFRTDSTPIQTLRSEFVCGTVPLPAPLETTVAFASGQGTKVQTAQILPAYIAATVAVKSTLAGRRRQGRFFLGGMDVSAVAGDNVSAGHSTLIQNYVNALMATFVTPGSPDYRFVVHSRYLSVPHAAYVDGNGNSIPAYTPGNCQDISAPVASLVVSGRATTMRSRKVGHGL